MAIKEKFKNLLQLSMLQAAEIKEQINDGDMDLLQELNEKNCRLLGNLESMVEAAQEEILDDDKPLEEIKTSMSAQKEHLNEIKNVNRGVKSKIIEKKEEVTLEELNHEIERQKIINEEAMMRLIKEQRELGKSTKQRIKFGEEWLQRRLEIETKSTKQVLQGDNNTPQTAKLQKYTITSFSGDYKDWVRFWNQFSVEVVRSTINEISKFNYLLELTKNKPKNNILGLPHTTDGDAEAKRILAETWQGFLGSQSFSERVGKFAYYYEHSYSSQHTRILQQISKSHKNLGNSEETRFSSKYGLHVNGQVGTSSTNISSK